jgi:carboxymethylenebutenolidase
MERTLQRPARALRGRTRVDGSNGILRSGLPTSKRALPTSLLQTAARMAAEEPAMHRKAMAFFSALLIASAVLAAGVNTEKVSYRSGDETVSGYLARPTTAGRHPALIVIHEWWGLNDWVRGKARDFAGHGYVALAVDLYRGKVATDPDTAHQLMRGMPEDRAIRDLKAAYAYLASRPDVDPAKIGSIGWCMGGGYSLAAAIAEPKLAATVIYYGRLVTDEAEIKAIHAPLLGNFGADDKGITPDSVRAFEEQAKKAGVVADFKIYAGCGHAFASSSDPKIYKAEAAKDADARADAWLAKYLKG